MKGLTDPYLIRADADFHTARRERNVRKHPNPSAICLHAHACVLRLLQARLRREAVPYPSTPHPVVLLECCLEFEPAWEAHRADLRTLHVHALNAANPDFPLEVAHAEAAFQACDRFRAAALNPAE